MSAADPHRRRCGVLGHPVSHSLSPLLHRTAYAQLGLDWDYGAHDVTEEALPRFLSGLDASWRGLSLTMPLKRTVLPLLDDLDPVARTVGAANTVLLDADGRHGANTDVPGLVAALTAAGGPAGIEDTTVVGGGATAASALAALASLGVRQVAVRVRMPSRATETLAVGGRLGIDIRTAGLDDPWPAGPQLVVSTIPSPVAAGLLPGDGLAGGLVVDAVYDPWPSPLLERAGRAGARTVTGLDLLTHQAVEQVRCMTGRLVDPAELLAAGLRELVRRTGRSPADGYPAGS